VLLNKGKNILQGNLKEVKENLKKQDTQAYSDDVLPSMNDIFIRQVNINNSEKTDE